MKTNDGHSCSRFLMFGFLFMFFSTWINAQTAPYDENLLINPSCDSANYVGWTVTNGGTGWAINSTECHSSFVTCTLSQ